MNSETDRITVPTNGHKPQPVAGEPAPAIGNEPAAADDHGADADADATAREPVARAMSPELTIAVTPAQVAVGFSVIAGIILLVLRSRRGRRRG